jgi:hypothetical protein
LVDNQVNPATGRIAVRGVFSNPKWDAGPSCDRPARGPAGLRILR